MLRHKRRCDSWSPLLSNWGGEQKIIETNEPVGELPTQKRLRDRISALSGFTSFVEADALLKVLIRLGNDIRSDLLGSAQKEIASGYGQSLDCGTTFCLDQIEAR
jgi:hypothetical protein